MMRSGSIFARIKHRFHFSCYNAFPTLKKIFEYQVLVIFSDDEHEINDPVFDDYKSLVVDGYCRGTQQGQQYYYDGTRSCPSSSTADPHSIVSHPPMTIYLFSFQPLQALSGGGSVLNGPCTLYMRITHHIDGTSDQSWACYLHPADGNGFVDVNNLDLTSAVSGETTLFAPNMTVSDNAAVIPDPTRVIFGETRIRDRRMAMAIAPALWDSATWKTTRL
jgi:hypothetical protein